MRWIPLVAAEDTLTMTPCPRSTIDGSAARQAYSVVISDRSISARISVSVNWVNGLKLIAPPTLLISTSMRPKAESACWDDRFSAFPVLEVRRDGECLVAVCAQFIGEFLDQLGAIGEHEGAAFGVDAARGLLTDALGRSCDHHDLAGEPAGRDEPRSACGGRVGHRAAHGLLGASRVGGDQRAGRVAVAGLEGADDVHVVLRAQRVAPRRVAKHFAHAAFDAERLIRLKQMVVAGQGEQVVVERGVGLCVLGRVHEVVVFHVGHGGLGQQPVPRQLL